MYFDTTEEDLGSDDGFEVYTGTALEMFLKVDPKSLTFMRYIHQITTLIRLVYPTYRPVNFVRDTTIYKTFLLELKNFLKDMDCPFKEFTSACIEVSIQNKRCRRRLIVYLNSEYTVSLKAQNYLKQINEFENSKDTPGTSSYTNTNEQYKLDDEDTVPKIERNVGPAEEQSSKIPQVVDEPAKKLVVDEAAKKGVTLEKKFGELTVDTQQPSQSVIPTLLQSNASQVHCSPGGSQYGNSDNNFQLLDCMYDHYNQTGGYPNVPDVGISTSFDIPDVGISSQNNLSNQNILPNQQQGYRQNNQGIWNSPVHWNAGLLQGANQNRGLNDVPSPYSPNQNLNIAQQQAPNCRPLYWSAPGSGNIPFTQSNQYGWNSQGPRNTGLPLLGYSYKDQQVGRVQGGEYQNPRIYGNMEHQLNNQQNYRPPTHQNMNIPRPQETYVSHGDGATYNVTNISIYPGQEGGNGQSGITGAGAYFSGLNNRNQRHGNMPHGEYQNPSCNGQNTNSLILRY